MEDPAFGWLSWVVLQKGETQNEANNEGESEIEGEKEREGTEREEICYILWW